jgi:DNA-directed RNA polymerase subunit RPC12/RpoP
MKCAECGKRTTWDESFGGENYIVCPKCFQRIREENKTDGIGTLQIIFQKSIDKSKKV